MFFYTRVSPDGPEDTIDHVTLLRLFVVVFHLQFYPYGYYPLDRAVTIMKRLFLFSQKFAASELDPSLSTEQFTTKSGELSNHLLETGKEPLPLSKCLHNMESIY